MSGKICFLIGNLNLSGGTERVTTLIANSLAAEGEQVCILNLSQGETPFFPLDARIENYALYPHAVSMKRQFLATVVKIRQFVKQHCIQHLVVVDSISCVFTVPALIGLKVQHICWEHFTFNVDLGLRLRQIGRCLAARYCDAVVTLTAKDAELWQQAIAQLRAKMVTIANPSPFNVAATLPTQAVKTVLAVGRLRPEKGFDLLLQAWQQVIKNDSDWTLRIVGSGEQEQSLKQLAKRLDIDPYVQWIAATPNISTEYQQASLYCLSSRFEGFGMVLLEALSFGLPIVSFDCPIGPREILKDSSNLLIEAENIEALAAGLEQMMHLEYSAYSQLCKDNQHRVADYSAAKIVQQWQKLLAQA
ncbi:glycosyltransferase family 4 protein [Acinetobacter sp. MD2(2019)]|uniref:glycosyltransferase family 4 protein n=1 Tax=Acinetobacter sp. MD2(2019) TaxID=2605273 RepID=UPI002D1E5465|nr:glycosyltransferase family 4 protein [Acinetobacter sp. MD2(2019)]MEB3754421.1 glycosyltransferase family 4 protein [Acinetobacter sp. MD2(2019)]